MHHHSADCCQHTHLSVQISDHIDPLLDTPIDSRAKQAQLRVALLLIAGFAVVEFIVGLFSHSLVLMADSGHMLSDGLALLLALLAAWAAQLPADQRGIFGNPRLEVGAALINSVVLSAIALWIGWEAIERLQTPLIDIASMPMLVTAAIGAGVNGVNVALLHRGSDHDLNLKAAFLHVLADTVSCIGVIVAAIAVAVFHWAWADGAVSLFVASLILCNTIPLVRQGLTRVVQSGQVEQ